jgi:UDP-N-acetylmuramoylalanine--D-glutamate ligase
VATTKPIAVAAPGRVLVLGLGRSGRAAVGAALTRGITVLATDDSGEACEQAELVAPEGAVARLGEVDALVVSPGAPADHPLVLAALDRGVEVISELEFAWRLLGPAPLYAVTGTNGKSTTTALLGHVLGTCGRKVFTGGNLGTPLSDAVAVACEDEQPWDCYVVEVSSFQLERVSGFAPDLAVLLNLTPDHLDRHGNMQDYLAAKLAVFARARHSVIGRDQDWPSRARADGCGGVPDPSAADCSSFGSSPLPAGDGGVCWQAEGRTVTAADGWTVKLPDHWPRVAHDFENVAAAAVLARLAGVSGEQFEQALSSFEPLPHRLVSVAAGGGLEFWNDSKATNTGSVLSSVAALDRELLLLMGGVDKGADFSEVASCGARIKTVIAYGAAAGRIDDDLRGSLRVLLAAGLEGAFAVAVEEAEAGDAVLLAPGCASFDEFADYAERGRRFEQLARDWVAGIGR